MGENILNKKQLDLLAKSQNIKTGLEGRGLELDDYLIVRINSSVNFAKVYLHVCRCISNNKIKFSPVNMDFHECGCSKDYIYKFFNTLVNLRYFSINKVVKVNTYVLTIPVIDFVTVKRLEAANKRLGV